MEKRRCKTCGAVGNRAVEMDRGRRVVYTCPRHHEKIIDDLFRDPALFAITSYPLKRHRTRGYLSDVARQSRIRAANLELEKLGLTDSL